MSRERTADLVGHARRAATALAIAAAVVAIYRLGVPLPLRDLKVALTAALAVLAYRAFVRGAGRRDVAAGALLGCAAVGALKLGLIAAGNLAEPRFWDFVAFWVDGSVGARGLNFYEPANYAAVYRELQIPIDDGGKFVTEIVDVGFKYPPMTMFLFCWMGMLPFGEAHVLWLGFVCVTFIAAVWLVARSLLQDGPLAARCLLAFAAVGLLPASASNMHYEQTSALVLVAAVLALSASTARSAGLLSALAIAVKPIMGLAIAYQLLRARWKAVAPFALAMIGMLAAAAVVFGPATVLDYARANPIANVPPFVYTEWINQSLLATLVREAVPAVPAGDALTYPPFLLAGGTVGLVSLWLAWRLARRDDPLAFGLLTAAALLLYPGTQTPYGMLMIIPIAQLCGKLWQSVRGSLLAAALVAVVYYVDAYFPFAAHAIVWSATSLWAARGDALHELLRRDAGARRVTARGSSAVGRHPD